MLNTIVYVNGEDYLGKYSEQSLDYWKRTGYIRDFKFMYKGYRYFGQEKNIVIVYTNKDWNIEEKARRKANGFLGIRQCLCKA